MTDTAAQLDAIRKQITAYCDSQSNTAFDPENPVVRLHEPTFGADEIFAATEILLSTWVTMGRQVRAFEAAFTSTHDFAEGVMNNSGSSANLLAIAALANPTTQDGLKPGDEVIVSALSWSTTVWPLIQLGLVPVIVDIDQDTLNIDPGEIERAIGPRTRAVMPVHVYGNPCDMDALGDICHRHNLVLIEDCCEALGAVYKGTPVGGFGRVATFSFYFSHHMTTIEGGICTTNDPALAEMARILRSHGWTRDTKDPGSLNAQHPDIDPRFLFVNLGYNLRPTEMQAAMGLIQLPKLAGYVEARRSNAAYWTEALAGHASILGLQRETEGGRHSWFGFPVAIASDAPFSTAMLREYLENAGIETRPIICGNIAKQPGLQANPHRTVGDLSKASHVMSHAISFGCHQAIDDGARAYVADRILTFLDANQ